ncbi:hypothetical protein BpHYR1_020549 [Brachionus plicatilis]|uniref:Uncharacterized protein n=1 Tax=Brachionus plicatilis TaxID=10195 RepID=A0A3M7S897_BRAPC|nr:hypothetical protein BpHYR1_020549 [Brachionus plicatilis]
MKFKNIAIYFITFIYLNWLNEYNKIKKTLKNSFGFIFHRENLVGIVIFMTDLDLFDSIRTLNFEKDQLKRLSFKLSN